jgi:hypothetical protein
MSMSEVRVVPAELEDAALRGASSKAVFERGGTYARSGAVSALTPLTGSDPGVRARVAGTRPYEVEVWLAEGNVEGSCDCPNGSDGWFCKHQVAVALVWRDELAGREPTLDPAAQKNVQATAKRAQTVRDRRQALAEFLNRQSAADLAARLMALADREPGLHRELQQWRKLDQATENPEDLKRLLTDILDPGRDFVSWQEVATYVHRAFAAVPLLQRVVGRTPEAAIGLAAHAMRRSWAAIERVDDSGGSVGELCRAIGAQYVAALETAGPRPADYGETYLKLCLDEPCGCFDAAAAEAALGAAALQRFRKHLAAQWREAKTVAMEQHAQRKAQRASSRTGRAIHTALLDRGYDIRLSTLERLHLAQLEAAGDVDGVLDVLRADLSSPWDFHRLTDALERFGRTREAFANAEHAIKTFPDDERLQDDMLRSYERDGWLAETLILRRRRFDAAPSVQRYVETLAAAAALGQDRDAVRQELLTQLAGREASSVARSGRLALELRGARAGLGAAPRDVSLRVAILCSEGRFEESLALVQPPAVCQPRTLEALADGLEPTHRAATLALLRRVFEFAMRDAKTPYREPLRLVERIASLLDTLERSAWLAGLRIEYKAKRNFVRDLPAG